MTLPTFTLRQLVEAGVHFGHHARRWNPQMAPYIYGKKDNVHIIDLQKTYPMLYTALSVARDVAAKGGKVLFVATKRQAQDIIKESAERCGQYYVNYRWLGGMLTNWKTVNKSINRLVKLNEMEEKNAYDGYTKKEMQNIKKEQSKLALSLDGIKNMGGQPDLLFVINGSLIAGYFISELLINLSLTIDKPIDGRSLFDQRFHNMLLRVVLFLLIIIPGWFGVVVALVLTAFLIKHGIFKDDKFYFYIGCALTLVFGLVCKGIFHGIC